MTKRCTVKLISSGFIKSIREHCMRYVSSDIFKFAVAQVTIIKQKKYGELIQTLLLQIEFPCPSIISKCINTTITESL